MTTIHTIGHSTRAADEFRTLLRSYGVETLIDVRQFPGSRRFPHFSSAALAASLASAGIDYVHEVDLGGRRKPSADSANAFWRNASFRAFADYMAQATFGSAVERLMGVAQNRAVAIMCAEAVPWRCHRWLVSDALVARGVNVVHILGAAHSQPHVLNPNARIDAAGTITYPAPLFADEGA